MTAQPGDEHVRKSSRLPDGMVLVMGTVTSSFVGCFWKGAARACACLTTALVVELEFPEEDAALLLHAVATMHVNAATAPRAASGLDLATTPILSPERSRPMLR
jgi:hypothetical protein